MDGTLILILTACNYRRGATIDGHTHQAARLRRPLLSSGCVEQQFTICAQSGVEVILCSRNHGFGSLPMNILSVYAEFPVPIGTKVDGVAVGGPSIHPLRPSVCR